MVLLGLLGLNTSDTLRSLGFGLGYEADAFTQHYSVALGQIGEGKRSYNNSTSEAPDQWPQNHQSYNMVDRKVGFA